MPDEPVASKRDAGKPRMDLIPPEELLELGGTFAIGAVKYGDDNWKQGDGLEWGRLFASTQRHLALFWAGEDYDAEDGHPHLMAAAFGCLTLRWLSKHRRHMDPRWHEDASEGDSDDGPSDTFEDSHGERRQWERPTRYAEAPGSHVAAMDPEAEAKLPLRILLGQRGLGKLSRYVGHKEDCQGFRGGPCKCGLDDAIKELRNA